VRFVGIILWSYALKPKRTQNITVEVVKLLAWLLGELVLTLSTTVA